jgi:hypothetical protein
MESEPEKGHLIPANRRIDWKPGIPGGIPTYPVFASVLDAPYSAGGDGNADDTHAIQQAIDDCPPGKAVHLPKGTYRLTAKLQIRKGIVLRGDGTEQTRLINDSTFDPVIDIGYPNADCAVSILRGYEKGSTSIEVADASKFHAGDLVLIDQLNDPEVVDLNGCGGVCDWASRDKGRRAMGQLVRIESISGERLFLSRPLYYTFKSSLEPEAVRSTKIPIVGAGLEDLYIETTQRRTDRSSVINIVNGIHCWVRNVESFNGWYAGHVTLQRCLGCEVRDGYFHHAHAYGSGHGYGVWIYTQTTDTLVENNIFYYLNVGMALECSGPGNVLGYNFSARMWGRDYPKTFWAHGDVAFHGAHPYMNLIEGNWISMFALDFYWGSASHNTFFRNYADMDCRTLEGKPMCTVVGFRIDKRNLFTNVLGNVIGHEGMEGRVENPEITDFAENLVWRLGYAAPSGKGKTDDPEVAKTLLRHGNFDFISNATQWDSGTQNKTLPESFYLNRKPKFFGERPWPAIGPDVTPMNGSLPARERFLAILKAVAKPGE